MKNFPGRSVAEIIALAVDIRACKGQESALDYVVECMIPAAHEQIENSGDCFMSSLDYSLSTVTCCAYKVAEMLDETGMVDIG